ncbi:MCE family protein [Saccharopolyspora flava]|uniref:Phospholipid/cholesterol/gamma-HCH transport system substrate-binding protein n=1 Tax=Saccharopolyspora flava TaxID=95161 RepID=A0A1I6SC78_9PSEU|nr:MCE family protein [Saccharopolyspora flava]SFS74460.1 phospholipid/cholesterol/gamma-HCH transport system substrate-binding protein [Saccharopolyspora flava]
MRRAWTIVAAATLLAVLAATGWYTVLRPQQTLELSADFAFADGIFPGNRVAILGVPVGTVREVRPAGRAVRVTMDLPPGTEVPADAHAYIVSPAVISDRYVELGPAHTVGPTLGDGTTIPLSRTHSPIKWDELTASLDTLLKALGPQGAAPGGVGELMRVGADSLDGRGPAIREAISRVAQATEVLADGRGDVQAVLTNVDRLLQLLVERKSTLDSLTSSTSDLTADFTAQSDQISSTLTRLSSSLTQVDGLLREHGDRLTGDVAQLTRLSRTLADHQRQLAETLDVLPLGLDNLQRTLAPDERMRLRLNVSTNLRQFDTTAALCERLPLPLCDGPGIVNPIPIPLPPLPLPTGTTGGGR